MESFDDIPAILKEPVFHLAFDIAEWVKYPSSIQDTYRDAQKVYWDNINTLRFALEEGHAEGSQKVAQKSG